MWMSEGILLQLSLEISASPADTLTVALGEALSQKIQLSHAQIHDLHKLGDGKI